MAKVDLRNRRPDTERLPDGRLRVTFLLDVVEFVGQSKAQIEADVFLATGVESADFPGTRLIRQRLNGLEPSKEGNALPLTRVYEELHATAETQVGLDTITRLEDGRTALTVEYIQLSAAAATTGTVGTTTRSGHFLQIEEVENDGTLRHIKRTFVSAGTLAQTDATKSGGKLLTRTIVSAKTEPATPAGYTLVDQSTKPANGFAVYTYTFAKGAGRVSTDVAFKQNGKLKITTIKYLDTDDGAEVVGQLVNDDFQKQDGYTVFTKGYAEIVDDGIISTDTQTRHNGKLKLYRIVRLGESPDTPAATIGGTVVATATDTRQEDGFILYDYRWSEGYGRIELSTEEKQGGALTLSTVRYFATDDGVAPAGVVIDTRTTKEDGVDLTTKIYADGAGEISRNVDTRQGGALTLTTIRHLTSLETAAQPTSDPGTATIISHDFQDQDGVRLWSVVWAAGSGEVSRETDTRLNGMLQRVTIRHLTAASVTVQPTSDPLSGGTITSEGRTDQDGYRLWSVTWTKANTETLITDEREERHGGKLVLYRRSKLGAAPDAPAASISGTVEEVESNTREEDGYTVYAKSWAEGLGELSREVDYSQSENQGTIGVTRTTIRHLTATSVAVDPVAPVVGSVKISEARADQEGVRLWTVVYAKGIGLVSQRIIPRTDGLREVVNISLGTKVEPTGVIIHDDYELNTGFKVYTVRAMQTAAGSATITTASLAFERYVPFRYPGRAKAFLETFNARKMLDVFRSPPVETEVLATVTISYQTSASLGTIANYWNPSQWATLRAQWVALGGDPVNLVEAMEGYRTESSTPLAANSAAVAPNDLSIFGRTVFGATTARIVITGGPTNPGGTTKTLKAEIEPAFTAVNGTVYYRKTVITAAIPAQAALPV